jgi:GNAT superfamily N-acetyltransferase
MGDRITDAELRRRAVDGLRPEVEAFGSGAPDSRLLRLDGLLATVTPATPQRSLFNSVLYEDAEALERSLDLLAETYADAGVRAWTVWVPDEDRGTAAMLADLGHALDAAPRAMAMELSVLPAAGSAPEGVDAGRGEPRACAELNDRAYGYGEDGFRAGLGSGTAIRWHVARDGKEALCCVGTIDIEDDCCVTGVATPPEHRGRGLASWLMGVALAEAAERGCRTASLQATRAGTPIYERLGFRDFGFIEMWERRR